VTVDRNDAESILAGTEELVHAVMERNGLAPDDIVSCIFTCTPDLDAEFPAVAARGLGLSDVPLICAREIDVPGALPRVIRVMVHCYTEDGRPAQHVYLRDAAALRRDLEGAQ
jgi:chorismate mutase